jgi:hypothetical protein
MKGVPADWISRYRDGICHCAATSVLKIRSCIVNLAALGMLVVSVARWLGSESPLLAYCAAPL